MSDRIVALVEEAFVVGRDGTDEMKRVLLELARLADDDGIVVIADDPCVTDGPLDG